jgi:adenylate cyclase
VARLVNSSDEVGNLAVSVESMISGLKERDKATSILHKFHGSHIAEDLLSSSRIERQGVRKNIAILFSDIRGFTSMSEKMEPEELVHFLNNYLNVMVKVITNNNGIIDKFIGDAIMAIWGAPHATGTEAYDSVKAALEMRMALIEFNKE